MLFFVGTPLVVGWIRLRGQHAGWYGTEFGVVLVATVTTVVLAMVGLRHAYFQGLADEKSEQAERDQRFLSEASELLRNSNDSSDALFQAAKTLGEYLGLSRCFFSQIDVPNDRVIVRRDYHHGLPSLAGALFSSSGSVGSIEDAGAGRTIISNDTRTDAKTAGMYETTYGPADIRSRVAVLFRKDGEVVASCVASTHEPRTWQAREVVLVESLAERAWLWYEYLVQSERVRMSEARLRAIVDSAFDAIVSIDDRGDVVEFTASAERLFGYCRSEMVGQPWAGRLVSPRSPQKHRDGLARYLQTGEALELGTIVELSAMRADGSEFDAAMAITRVKGVSPPLFTGYIRDITEQKQLAGARARAEAVLREAEQRFHALVDASAQIVWSTSASGEVVEDSPSWRAFTGQTREEWQGRGWLDACHPDDRERTLAIWRNAVETRTMMQAEYRIWHVNGEWRWTAVRAVPLFSADGGVREWVGMNTDITERKRGEHEKEELLTRLRDLNAELEARVQSRTADLTTTIGERDVLLQEVHHRVKNNLQMISSLINMQVRQLPDDGSRSVLEECQLRVGAIALIHEKLYQSKDFGRVPFSEYTSSLAASIVHATGVSPAPIALDVKVESIALPVDKAIPCGLILNELITNALKHAFPGNRCGAVQVELRRSGDRNLVVSVSDDGIGMPATYDPVKASSLGLQIVQTLAEQLEGQVELIRGKGTTFTITFPLEAP